LTWDDRQAEAAPFGTVAVDADSLLPTQGWTARYDSPEKRLMAAVLEDALDVYYRSDTKRTAGRRQEAYEWIWADDPRWPFSFRCICDILDLDADAIRSRIVHHPHRIRMPRRYTKRSVDTTWSSL
jgi:hypothetical protein